MQPNVIDPAIIGLDIGRSPQLHKGRYGRVYIDRTDFLELAERVGDDFDVLCVIKDDKPKPILFIDNGFYEAAFDDGDEEGLIHPLPYLPVIKHFGLDKHDYTCTYSRDFLENCAFCYFSKEVDNEYRLIFAVLNKVDGQAVSACYCPSAISVPILDRHFKLV